MGDGYQGPSRGNRWGCMAAIIVGIPVFFLLLTGAPAGFKVDPCTKNGVLGFGINGIDGWFRDYKPRPDDVSVTSPDAPHFLESVYWSTTLEQRSNRDNDLDLRPARGLVFYGQRFAGWDISTPAGALSRGKPYYVNIAAGRRMGRAGFIAGAPQPAC